MTSATGAAGSCDASFFGRRLAPCSLEVRLEIARVEPGLLVVCPKHEQEIHMDKALANSIGMAARRARVAKGFTQEQAAERIEVSVEFYARIERGRSLPSVKTLVRMAEALDVSADAMLGNEPLDSVGGAIGGGRMPAVRVRRRKPRPDDSAVSDNRTPEAAPAPAQAPGAAPHGEAA